MKKSKSSQHRFRADLCYTLAEALAEPPDWMAQPGRQWPLFEASARLGQFSEAAREVVGALAEIQVESLEARRSRYKALFASADQPRFWLYESKNLSGILPGPETFAVEQLYQAAGLEISNAELPDHAALELTFLAYLIEKQDKEPERTESWRRLERLFIKKHAGRWLPDLGRGLSRTGDPVYAPIGTLLTGLLEEARRRSPRREVRSQHPVVSQVKSCTLCGFCVQVCPTRALNIRETRDNTSLMVLGSACIGCQKCERICETHAIEMRSPVEGDEPSSKWRVLHQSPRAHCPTCGEPTVSQAELAYVITQIGHPAWLDTCLACRAR